MEIHLLKIMMIDNNITSTVDDQLKHLYKLLNYINYRTFIILLFTVD